ncbi:cell wall metabolism sensor histidine kinase WalK [Paenibacillus sp. y28]|uniref:cell wall metabolism sensor histidine kinase WalK n=1 Tax=Paenibacillus sp. y28 TaxID=3129110 RepID=UPI0030199D73
MKGIRFFQSIQIRIIIIYVLLILLAMQVIGVYFVRTMEHSFKDNFTNSLNDQAYLLAEITEKYLKANQEVKAEGDKSYDELSQAVNNLFAMSRTEIQIIDANGIVRVLSTSQENRKALLNQKNTQKEVSQALQGIRDIEQEIELDGDPKKVIAQPVGSGGKVLGAVYIVASMDELYNTMNRINKIFISGTLIALGLTALLGIILSHTITNPIKEATKQATAVAEGNFNQLLQVKGEDEISQLGKAFNYMTHRLKDALAAGEEEKEKLASILSNMSDGVIATDDQGTVIVMNRRAKQMLEIQDGSPAQSDISALLGISHEDIGRMVRSENNTVMISIPVVDEEEELTVRVVFTPIYRRDRGFTGTIAVLQDVTEQEKLELSRREFVANVSHELRTPLTTIKSYLEALDDGALEDEQLAKRFVGVTRNETERMIRLVHDLLQLSRLDSRQALISKEPTDVSVMLEEVADRFSFQLRQRNIDIRIDVQPGIGEIMLDRDQIDQVLDNLVSNASKYTLGNGSIYILARKTGKEWLEISVRDTGIGIPKKDLNRIFERFYRVDKARSRNMGGTGLGLSIAREIIRAHGGTITLESELHQGTKVCFTLPLLYSKESDEP